MASITAIRGKSKKNPELEADEQGLLDDLISRVPPQEMWVAEFCLGVLVAGWVVGCHRCIENERNWLARLCQGLAKATDCPDTRYQKTTARFLFCVDYAKVLVCCRSDVFRPIKWWQSDRSDPVGRDQRSQRNECSGKRKRRGWGWETADDWDTPRGIQLWPHILPPSRIQSILPRYHQNDIAVLRRGLWKGSRAICIPSGTVSGSKILSIDSVSESRGVLDHIGVFLCLCDFFLDHEATTDAVFDRTLSFVC